MMSPKKHCKVQGVVVPPRWHLGTYVFYLKSVTICVFSTAAAAIIIVAVDFRFLQL